MTAVRRRACAAALIMLLVSCLTGCGWHGLNTLPMPGTHGQGPGSYEVKAQLPDVTNLQPNSRVRVGDVNVGTIRKIERQGWHAVVTMRLDGDVDLPANCTAKIGQTSLLGSLHVELAGPTKEPPHGRLHEGSLIPLSNAGAYPTTERTLSSLSLLLGSGGIGQVQDITAALSTAFAGRENDLRGLLDQLNDFSGRLDDQTGDIIAATDALNRLTGQFAAQKPVVDKALHTIPDALQVLAQRREQLTDALTKFGQLSAVTVDTVNKTKKNLVAEVSTLEPVLRSLADAGPALTRSLSLFSTYPWPKETIQNWYRGDYANLTLVLDLTLSRLDNNLLTGTRYEGNLTTLELQWGRTIGQPPSPATNANPLTVPYHLDQGP